MKMRDQLETDTKDAPKAVTSVPGNTQSRADEKMQTISLQKQYENDTLLINKCTQLISSINTSSLFYKCISKIAFTAKVGKEARLNKKLFRKKAITAKASMPKSILINPAV